MTSTKKKRSPGVRKSKKPVDAQKIVAANLKRIAAEEKAASGVPAGKRPAKGPGSEKAAKPLSGLGAAYQVLAFIGKPATIGEIMAAIEEQKLWKSSGKTPGATIQAAIIREIASKGKVSRFQKTGRGLFAAS